MFNLKQKSSEETDLRLKTKTNSNFISTVFHRFSLFFANPGGWENSPWTKENIFWAIYKNIFWAIEQLIKTCFSTFLLTFPRVTRPVIDQYLGYLSEWTNHRPRFFSRSHVCGENSIKVIEKEKYLLDGGENKFILLRRYNFQFWYWY